MEPGEFKPLLKALALPPTGLLLVVLAGIVMGWRRRLAGALVAFSGLAGLWLLSCNAVAVALSQWLLPPVVPVTDKDLQGVQAIVVLGGGLQPHAPEYGSAQPARAVLPRVRYAAVLARRTGKPVAVSAGLGWGTSGVTTTEAEVYARTLVSDYGVTPKWIEDKSRDTRENAQMTAALMRADGIRRIALVTDATHMPRSVRNFREAGFDVVPAPTSFLSRSGSFANDWLPNAGALANSYYVIHEWLGVRLT